MQARGRGGTERRQERSIGPFYHNARSLELTLGALITTLAIACAPAGDGVTPRRAQVESRFSLVEAFEDYGSCNLYEVKLTTGVLKNVLICDEYSGVNATVLD